MSLESVRAFFAEKAPNIAVIESGMSSATVTLAAEAYGVEPARIAKTLSLRIGERVVLIVAAGTSRMDNKKVKALFGVKPKMLGLDEVAEITGHEVGGVAARLERDLRLREGCAPVAARAPRHDVGRGTARGALPAPRRLRRLPRVATADRSGAGTRRDHR